ncbi:serine/threonine protein kinase, partial [Amycolatopsis sp. H20-H5]|uniref:serine/threonine protein kinase n=1 Tax=Amycolatopsis sp. H20-H5 TaxID=3046309 RepID=UPI002DBB1C3E
MPEELPAPEPAARPTRTTNTMVTRAQQTAGHGTGGDHVPLPQVELPDLTSRIVVDPLVPEDERYCGRTDCRTAVGRSAGGGPAPTQGYCSACGT